MLPGRRPIRPLGLSHVQTPKKPTATQLMAKLAQPTATSSSLAFFSQQPSDDLLPQLRTAPMYKASDPKQTLSTLESLLDTDYYRDKIVILTFLRRFGCPVCRAVSTGLSFLKEAVFDKHEVRLVAVAIENVGYEEFHRKQFFKGDVFVDSSGEVFRLLKLKKLGMNNIYGVGDLGKVRAAVALAMASNGHFGDGTNFDGDLAQLGGMFIINGRRDHFVMEFREQYAGDTPVVYDILQMIGVNGDILNEYKASGKRVLDLAKEALESIRKEAQAQGLLDPTSHQAVLQSAVSNPKEDVETTVQEGSSIEVEQSIQEGIATKVDRNESEPDTTDLISER